MKKGSFRGPTQEVQIPTGSGVSPHALYTGSTNYPIVACRVSLDFEGRIIHTAIQSIADVRVIWRSGGRKRKNGSFRGPTQ